MTKKALADLIRLTVLQDRIEQGKNLDDELKELAKSTDDEVISWRIERESTFAGEQLEEAIRQSQDLDDFFRAVLKTLTPEAKTAMMKRSPEYRLAKRYEEEIKKIPKGEREKAFKAIGEMLRTEFVDSGLMSVKRFKYSLKWFGYVDSYKSLEGKEVNQ